MDVTALLGELLALALEVLLLEHSHLQGHAQVNVCVCVLRGSVSVFARVWKVTLKKGAIPMPGKNMGEVMWVLVALFISSEKRKRE